MTTTRTFSSLTNRTAIAEGDEIVVQPTGSVPPERMDLSVVLEAAGGGGSGSPSGPVLVRYAVTENRTLATTTGTYTDLGLGSTAVIDLRSDGEVSISGNDVTLAAGAWDISVEIPGDGLSGGNDRKTLAFRVLNADSNAVIAGPSGTGYFRSTVGTTESVGVFKSNLRLVLTEETAITLQTGAYWAQALSTATMLSDLGGFVEFLKLEVGSGGSGGATTAAQVSVNANSFNGNLSNSDTDVQAALDTIDGLSIGSGGGGGTDDQTAREVPVIVTSFSTALGSGDTDVQAALDTLDAHGHSYSQIDGRLALSDDAPVNTGTTPSAGNSNTVSRSNHNHGISDSQTAALVPVDASGFSNNLSSTDNNVQLALTTIDGLNIGSGGGGTDDQTAAEVPVTATGFTGNLSSSDTDVQKALETLDALSVGGGGGGTDTFINSASVSDNVLTLGYNDSKEDLTVALPAVNPDGDFALADVGSVSVSTPYIRIVDGIDDVSWTDAMVSIDMDDLAGRELIIYNSNASDLTAPVRIIFDFQNGTDSFARPTAIFTIKNLTNQPVSQWYSAGGPGTGIAGAGQDQTSVGTDKVALVQMSVVSTRPVATITVADGVPPTPGSIRDALETLTGNARLNASAIQGLPTVPTAAEIKTALETLTGDARLDASAVKNLPSGGGGAAASYPAHRIGPYWMVDCSGGETDILIRPVAQSSTQSFAGAIVLDWEDVTIETPILQIMSTGNNAVNLRVYADDKSDIVGRILVVENLTAHAIPLILGADLVPGDSPISVSSFPRLLRHDRGYATAFGLDNDGNLVESTTQQSAFGGGVGDLASKDNVNARVEPKPAADVAISFVDTLNTWQDTSVRIEDGFWYNVELVRLDPDTPAQNGIVYPLGIISGHGLFAPTPLSAGNVTITDWRTVSATYTRFSHPDSTAHNRTRTGAIALSRVHVTSRTPPDTLAMAWSPEVAANSLLSTQTPTHIRVHQVF